MMTDAIVTVSMYSRTNRERVDDSEHYIGISAKVTFRIQHQYT